MKEMQQLEKRIEGLQSMFEDMENAYEVEREAFAKRCFLAGRASESPHINNLDERTWLQFKAEEL